MDEIYIHESEHPFVEIKFKDPKYVGDPINTVRIFNEKEVDELSDEIDYLLEYDMDYNLIINQL